jgi:hypothetical protein
MFKEYNTHVPKEYCYSYILQPSPNCGCGDRTVVLLIPIKFSSITTELSVLTFFLINNLSVKYSCYKFESTINSITLKKIGYNGAEMIKSKISYTLSKLLTTTRSNLIASIILISAHLISFYTINFSDMSVFTNSFFFPVLAKLIVYVIFFFLYYTKLN